MSNGKEIPKYKYFNGERFSLEMFVNAEWKDKLEGEAYHWSHYEGRYTRIVKMKHKGKTVYALYLRKKAGFGD